MRVQGGRKLWRLRCLASKLRSNLRRPCGHSSGYCASSGTHDRKLMVSRLGGQRRGLLPASRNDGATVGFSKGAHRRLPSIVIEAAATDPHGRDLLVSYESVHSAVLQKILVSISMSWIWKRAGGTEWVCLNGNRIRVFRTSPGFQVSQPT